MALVTLAQVEKHYGDDPVISDVTARIESGRKIGIIGRNGAGKSTLLKLIEGREQPSKGQVARQREARLAFLTQELEVDPDTQVRDELRRVFAHDDRRAERMRAIEDELAASPDEATQTNLLAEYARLEEEHRTTGHLDVDQRIAQVLTGLGLPEADWDAPIGRFSGGERNLIGLARILLAAPDLALLDEPSNHLDMDGVEWFIRWMRRSPQAVVMVSHDRHLLDAVADEIWEVEFGRLKVWKGNYSDWRAAKDEALALQERQFKVQERTIKRLEFQVRRLKDMARAYDDPGQARRAKAMQKRIEQMEKVEKPREEKARIAARLDRAHRHGEIALRIEDLDVRRGDRQLLTGAKLELRYGDRACLLGPNGCGKSSLFDEIRLRAREGGQVLRLGSGVALGDFRQFHEEALSEDRGLHEELIAATGLSTSEAADLLHRFLFSHEDLERPVSTLSGGEKSRLQLARLVHAKVNFLMLDEPTNHLDIASAEELEGMLADFDGTLFIISHDRWFLDGLVDQVVEIRHGQLLRFPGTVQEWWDARREEGLAREGGGPTLSSAMKASSDPAGAEKQREDKQARLEAREKKKAAERERRKMRRRFETVEKEIAKLEGERERIEKELEAAWSPGGDPARGPKLQEQLREVQERTSSLEEEWEELGLAIEEMEEAPES